MSDVVIHRGPVRKPGIALTRNLRVYVKFVPQDFWIGIFYDNSGGDYGLRRRLYVCLLPMVPIVFQWAIRSPFEREIERLGGAPSSDIIPLDMQNGRQ